jgi:hypothetical protein
MSKFCNVARDAMLTAMLVTLTGCGGGGGSDSPQGSNPPAPAPAPAPAPSPSPSPSPSDPPPLSSTVVNLTDNHRIGVEAWPNGNSATGGQGAPVDGIECLLNMPEAYHVHTHVTIYNDGVAQSIPQLVGTHNQDPSRCFYGIHTHDFSGKIHIEFAAPGMYTLGNLFHIWGQPLQSDNVAGITGKPISLYVTDNATVTKVASNWDAIELTTHKEITIVIGTAISEIPNYTWNGN